MQIKFLQIVAAAIPDTYMAAVVKTASNMSTETNIINLAAELTIAWLANPNTRVDADAVPEFLASIHNTVGKLETAPAAHDRSVEQGFERAVSPRKSLADPNFIISMIDGRPYKSLKRHLSARGLTPAQYRERYGLKPDYPMVAPAYSQARSEAAKKLGLGRKPVKRSSKPADADRRTTGARKGKGVNDAKGAAKAHLQG